MIARCRRPVQGLAAAFVAGALSACGGDDARHPPPGADAPEVEAARASRPRVDPRCRALATDAELGSDPFAAPLLPHLCRELPLDPRVARLAALGQPNPRWVRDLPGPEDDEWVHTAALWRRPAAELTSEATAPDPVEAVVSPLDASVLTQLDHAVARTVSADLSRSARVDARAFSARVHLEALAAAGLDPARPLAPMLVPLAGPALDHALRFLAAHHAVPTRRLAARARSLELAVLDLRLALQHHPPEAMDPLTQDAAHRAWSYLRDREVQDRLDEQLERIGRSREGYGSDQRPRPGPEALDPPSLELRRLLRAGLADAAIETAVALATHPRGPGPAPVETDLLRLVDEELSATAADAAREATLEAFAPLRARGLGPEPYEARTEAPWPTLQDQRDEVLTAVDGIDGLAPGTFARKEALARALLMLHARPRVEAAVLADARCPEALRRLLASSAGASAPDEDAQERRRFALP